ncbi:hypothetical protein RclHR1_09840003 [Rhizophagus clarus]|uniref:Ricin B lectin domain-containing protein n=1 Tax=Rhizophagus clarus TaxID=94130 RepID=A0A2Z6SQU8_9GLOM|nr:hypothetical protein RclHR1_09840003 [Rhizophagus clarus]GES87311.1 hypothetical protein RCL_jg22178.t1 [Rhizophagus clarus]
MKFNSLLLILTTLTAVALSQQLPYLIQSVFTGGFLIENTEEPSINLGRSGVHGSDWVVTKRPNGNYLILDKSRELAVQFVGVERQITLKPKDGSIAQESLM